MCATITKDACRRLGISRWPFEFKRIRSSHELARIHRQGISGQMPMEQSMVISGGASASASIGAGGTSRAYSKTGHPSAAGAHQVICAATRG